MTTVELATNCALELASVIGEVEETIELALLGVENLAFASENKDVVTLDIALIKSETPVDSDVLKVDEPAGGDIESTVGEWIWFASHVPYPA